MQREEILKEIKATFQEFHVPFVLIGAFALAVWGVIRATKDIDFLADISQDKMNLIEQRFKKAGFITKFTKGDLNDPIAGVLKIIYKLNKKEEVIDIILGIKGAPKDVYKRAKNIVIMGNEIPVVSPEDLVVLKLFANSPLDIEDARKIISILNDRIDYPYIEEICRNKKIDINLLKPQ